MLQNAHLLSKIGADTAENERNFRLPKFCQNFATTLWVHYPTGAARAARHRDRHLAGGGGVRVSGGLRARRRVLRRLLVRRLGGE